MRKLLVFNMMSLDGYFAAPDGALDWHRVDDEFNAFAAEQLDSVDSLLFGRVTYQLMAGFWPTELAARNDPVVAGKMNEKEKVAFSRTLSRAEWANTRLVKERAAEEVAAMKHKPGRDMIILGSANLAAALAQEGLIDEYRVMVNPVVLGGGRPLFPEVRHRLKLGLLSTRVFGSGNVLLTYHPG